MAELPTDSTHLDWANVGLGFSFVLFNALVSTSLQLGVGSSLLSAAIRCVVQLALVALVLQKVFETNNPWAVAGIACESDLY
jgi:ABC-type iron transport system FetAB permease component